MIDSLTKQKILDAADIVDVVSDYVHLIRRGANYMGLCPFHNERTPSFSVNKRKNFCYCFSCKKGGSPLNFIMQKEGLSYRDALIHLANKYGIEVVERELTDDERRAQSEREAMLVANEWAMLNMEKNLEETADGRDVGLSYLFQRGVTVEAIKKFHLGYALNKPDALCRAAKQAGFDIEVFKKLGLVGQGEQGDEYDRFRGRVIFPILNSAGKVIAFGGRDLKGGLAKYINSPESEIYKKSNELYGIFQARAEIVKEDKCYLVEGYLDVIGMWQAGMRNTVASSGTALTDGQISLIHRFTNNITLIYDGDQAGIKAALRGIDMLLSHNMKVKVLLLPDGDDPDSFAKKHTPEEFQEYLKEHETDIIRFKANVLLKDIDKDPQSRIDAINSVVTSIAQISDPVARDVYIQECSQILGVADVAIVKSVARQRAILEEKWKKDRARKKIESMSVSNDLNKIDHNETEGNQQAEVGGESNNATADHADIPFGTISSKSLRESKFIQLEKKVIEYAVKYGFLDFCSYIDSDGEKQTVDVITYIDEELEIDSLHFSLPVFNRIFTILKDLKTSFVRDVERFNEKLESEAELKLKEGIDNLASSNKTMSEIVRAEKNLREEIDVFKKEEYNEYAKMYPGQQLTNHEEEDVRQLAFELIQEPHQLSHIFTRDNNNVEREEDKLELLIPRVLTEWRNEILQKKLDDLFQKLAEIKKANDFDAENKVMQQINSIINMRAKVAKEIGDRIIAPKYSK